MLVCGVWRVAVLVRGAGAAVGLRRRCRLSGGKCFVPRFKWGASGAGGYRLRVAIY